MRNILQYDENLKQYFLQLGEITTEEIALWEGITYHAFQNRGMQKNLIEFEEFCDFYKKPDSRGIYIITYIHKANYEKKYERRAKQFLINEIFRCIRDKTNQGFNSLVGTARLAVAEEERWVKGRTPENIAENVFGPIVKELFGKGKKEEGIMGTRIREWAVKLTDYDEHRPMTAEEKDFLDDLKDKFRLSLTPKQQNEINDAALWKKYNEEQMEKKFGPLRNRYYEEVIRPFEIKFGGLPVYIYKYVESNVVNF